MKVVPATSCRATTHTRALFPIEDQTGHELGLARLSRSFGKLDGTPLDDSLCTVTAINEACRHRERPCLG